MVRVHVLLAVSGLVAGGCGVSNAERPFPPDAAGSGMGGAGPAPGPAADAGVALDTRAPDAGAVPADAAVADTAAAGDGGASGQGSCQPAPVPACDAPAPDPGARRPWRGVGSGLLAAGGARHRGRDQVILPGQRQWLIAKLAYGPLDIALTDEDVDIYLLRGCGARWESLGTLRSHRAGGHPGADGVTDAAGRVFRELVAGERLAAGRHRVRFVVAGDLSAAEAFVEVVPAGTRLAVSDVDGTLTPNETAEFGALLTGAVPAARPGAAAAMTALADRGYRPLYLSARPEWLVERTRQFLAERGLPPGLVRTTTGSSGALGAAAVSFKTAELKQLAAAGLAVGFAFGNTDTDAEAYAGAGVDPASRRIFLGYDDTRFGGRRIDDWGSLQAELASLPASCP
jgi:hypothetical protein